MLISPYSCHKPSAQEEYASAVRCYAALGANVDRLSNARFASAGLDRDAVEFAVSEQLAAAYASGQQIGLPSSQVLASLEQAKATYVRAHSKTLPNGAGRRFNALGGEVNNCLRDVFGSPND